MRGAGTSGMHGETEKRDIYEFKIDKFAQHFQNLRRPVHKYVRIRTHLSTYAQRRVFTYSKRTQWNLARDGEGRFDSNERTNERTVSVGLARASYKSAMLIGLSSCRR